MSKIKIEINLDNATFAGEDLGPSIADALDNLACRMREQNRKYLAQPGQSFVVRDDNGTSVGKATLHDVEEDFEEAEEYISGMYRSYLVDLLEDKSVVCDESDHIEDLREALLQLVKDDELTLEDIKDRCGD